MSQEMLDKKNKLSKAPFVLTLLAVAIGYGSTFINTSSEKEQAKQKVSVEAQEVDKEVKQVFEEGEHYVSIDPVYGLPERSVVEVFWYGCPHCYNTEKMLASEDFKEKSKDWSFQKYHIAAQKGPAGFDFNIFAALTQMGLEKEIGGAYMKALHEDGLDRGDFSDFAKKHGLSAEAIEKLSKNEESKNSFAFISQFSDRPEFKGVPAFIVEGKYLINGRYDVADVANFLLEKENGK